MKTFEKELKEYIEINKLTHEECAKNIGIDKKLLENIDSQPIDISNEEKQRILNIINPLPTGKKINRILDLIFRFGACIMALVTLLLCINGDVDYKILIVLLSIGLVCSTITGLPKIDK